LSRLYPPYSLDFLDFAAVFQYKKIGCLRLPQGFLTACPKRDPRRGRQRGSLMSDPFFPVLVLFFFAGLVVLGLLSVAQTAGPKKPSPVKAEPFESGNPPKGDARIRFPVNFYLVAMLFLIFDLEAVFLYPWAVMFRRLGIFGLVEMGIFLFIAAIGFIYAWKKGALDLE